MAEIVIFMEFQCALKTQSLFWNKEIHNDSYLFFYDSKNYSMC